MTANAQKLYTLEQAKLELGRARCAELGHSWRISTPVGSEHPDFVLCDRCGRRWSIGEEVET